MRYAFGLAALLLLSGCTAMTEERASSTSQASADGIDVVSTVVSEAGRHLLTARASNNGTRTFLVSSICSPVFHHSVLQGLEEVWPGPQVVCQAYGVKDFAPGDVLTLQERWDEVAVEDDGQERAAGKGQYMWQVLFRYKTHEDGTWLEISTYVPMVVR